MRLHATGLHRRGCLGRAFLTEHRDAYARVDAATKGLTTDECELAGGEVG